MFKKDKLDRLIEKHDVKYKANYDVLDCVKGKIQTEEFDGNGVVSINRKKTIIIVCCIAMLIVLITGLLLGILLTKDTEIEIPPIYYCYTETNRYVYESMPKYCQDKNIDIKYFTGLTNTYEVVRVMFDDNKQDVLICQDIVLEDTYETILLWVSLKDNYIFEFLKLNDLAAEVATINNVTVNYRTKYIEQTCSYISYIKYRYKNNTYWLTTDLLEEFAWKDFVAQLIR